MSSVSSLILRPMFGAWTVAVLLAGALAAEAADTKKSLVFMLDGTRADGIINASTPNIDRLIDGSFGGGSYRGAYACYAQTIQDAPTSSAYNHVSIMTGVDGVKHGVASNNSSGIAAVDYASWPTYLSTLESHDPGLHTVFLATWGADLAMVTGADYDKQSSDAGNVANLVAILAGTYADPSGDNGTSWAAGTDVDAIAMFMDDNDAAGHGHGFSPAVPAYLAAIESIDAEIGQILTAIENRPDFANEDWQIVVTTDHGGLGTGHGGLNPNSETIPFIVASKTTTQGLLAGTVYNKDAAATAISHMLGAGAVPVHHDGLPQGSLVLPPPPADLTEDLVLYLPFNGNALDASGAGNHATEGPGSDHSPTLHAGGGKFGGYLEIDDLGGGSADASYLTLGNPVDLEFGSATSFTIATWFRSPADQTGDPVILGNKNWVSGGNTGTLMLANEGNGNDFGFNLSDGTSRRDVEAIDYEAGDWWLQVASVDRSGNAVMYIGSPDGLLYVLSDVADDLGDVSSALPWNIGQDGTGSYPHNLDGDVDEMAIWRRALTLGEVQALHNDGSGIELLAAVCGNSIAEAGELCDGTDLGGGTCTQQGCSGGALACNATCSGYDTSGCIGCPACNGNGSCEAGEDCDNCPSDCIGGSSPGAACGNAVCEAGNGEDCVSCPADCNGRQNGKPSRRYCCGDGGGSGAVSCNDDRCTAGGRTCENVPVDPSAYCCGDAVCDQPGEGCSNCGIDCGGPVEICDNGLDDNCDGSADCDDDDCLSEPICQCSDFEICTNGVDDDCDGFVDCEDAECSSHASCSCSSRGATCSANAQCCSGNCRSNGRKANTCS